MTDVSVIGLGTMGAAIAETLLRSGRSVTVWNRTISKAEPLMAQGASLAETPLEAIAASPSTIVCVDNYDVSMAILSDSQKELSGRTMIQLTSDTGTAADEMAQWVRSAGASYLDGVILAYPSDIGAADAVILLAGEDAAWRDSEPLMRDIAGGSTFVGENVRVPAMLSAALIAPLVGAIIGAAQGAVLCEAEDFPVEAYAGMVGQLSEVVADQVQNMLATISEDRFEHPEAALKTYASSIADRTAESRQRGTNVEFYGFVDDLLARAIEHGLGDQELSAVIKLWRSVPGSG